MWRSGAVSGPEQEWRRPYPLEGVGDACVRPAPRVSEPVQIADITLCTVQAFADEWQAEGEWDLLCKNPVRTLVDAFKRTGLEHPLQQPWARHFKHNNQPATQSCCNQVQFSAKVETAALPTLLKESGHNRAYLTARSMNGHLLEGWSVIWISSDKADATRQAIATTQQCGLVRSKGRYGIRVADADFSQVYKALKPALPVPDRLQVLLLGPVLHGADEVAVTAWARTQHWRIKVLKALGPRQWLVGSQEPAPQGWHPFNGETLLILPVTRRQQTLHAVQAGHRALVAPAETKPAVSAKEDDLQTSDPWKEYLNALPSRASQPRPSMPVAAADQLGQHDRRLKALEASLDEVKATQASQQAQQAADRQAATRDMQETIVLTGRSSADCSKKPRKGAGPETGHQMDESNAI